MKSTPIERSVCSAFLEPMIFEFWKSVAGQANPGKALSFSNVEEASFVTTDSREIRGFKISAIDNKPRGYILFSQGNAMLADQIIPAFASNRSLPGFHILNLYDFYVYDYRGYGLSEGKPRLQAIVNDYKQLTNFLNSQGYERKLLYGISFGGITLINSIGSGTAFDRFVIDSTPSRIGYGCPKRYDPIENLPHDCSKILVISGEQDQIVPKSRQKELMEIAQKRGATILNRSDFNHPFQDRNPYIREERLKISVEFLTRINN